MTKQLKKSSARVRKIRTSDREDILDISSKIWGGHDYLPSVIDEWLADSKCHTYGVEAFGRIVAVGNLKLVDRGKTGWMEGLRVHVDHRKQGYANMLTQHLVSLGENLKVKRLRYTTGANNRASIRLAKMAGFKRLFKMSVFWHENLKAVVDAARLRTTVREITPSEASKIHKDSLGLVPGDILIYDWKAVDGTPAGFREVGKDQRFYARMKADRPKSFSLGHLRKDSKSRQWCFTIYACGPNMNESVTHFKNHVKIALDMGFNSTVCTAPTQFEKAFKTGQLPKPRWKMQLIMFEKQMNRETQTR